VARADRRWFLITFGVFALSVGLIFGARALYRWTGPHPGMTLFFRRLRRWARWIIPRHRRHRKWWW
jgi:hypothetical protein